jgi:hypothetical protein
VSETEYAVDTGSLKPDEYRVQILALNAIRVGRSNVVTVRLDGKPGE